MAKGRLTSPPEGRVRRGRDVPVRATGRYVLYWMTAARRVHHNYALDRAVQLAEELGKPLIVLEALGLGYPYANARMHSFVLQGMADNRQALAETDVHYYPYVEPRPGDGKGLIRELFLEACALVADDSPIPFLRTLGEAATEQVECRLEFVDSNGVLPIAATDHDFKRAVDFRRFLQRELAPHLRQAPAPNPTAGVRLRRLRGLPGSITRRWPVATDSQLQATPRALQALPIDGSVSPADLRGGATQARERLAQFTRGSTGLASYDGRNHPDRSSTSGLSPYLHFGHIGAHEVLRAVLSSEGWKFEHLGSVRNGARSGWWGTSPATEGFLDQLVTWRELGLNFAFHRDDLKSFDSLPAWAQATLEDHASDPRPHLYTLGQLEAAETHDPIWNAAQTELLESGRIHNYLRMLWGKKILEWSESPRQALQIMLELNDRYALDGRDPNSYSGILWVLGRYDRAWGPERPIFGKVRYMSSENTRRKLRLDGYLRQWGSKDQCALLPFA